MNAKEILKILKQNGFYEVRQKGGHIMLKNSYNKMTVVPFHGKQDVKIGTLKKIEKDTGVKLQ